MNKQQLASKIWESANKMRSKIEANEYKDYILGFIFYKYLSDKELRFLKENDFSEEDIKSLSEEDLDSVKFIQDNIGYFIAYKNLFSTWIELKGDFSVENVRDALRDFASLIGTSYKKVFENVFKTLDTGLSKLGDTEAKQSKAISGLLDLIKDIPMDNRQDYDVLGFIYEYLISMFAANAGKKAGEFYTPHEVSILMSEIVANKLKDKKEIKIYDPTSGSGSLLINIGKSVAKHLNNPDAIQYYAQELKENTYNLTRMNLVMRGIKPNNVITRNADTLEDDWPYFDESDPTNTYDPLYVDAVVSNPPYSQVWDPSYKEHEPRYRFGLAPKSKADYAFLLHDLYHLRPDGIMTIVLPHGVLFRGGEEAKIRQNLLENWHIEAVIGLPANIFFGTGIPTIIMVLKQERKESDVLIVDASKGFIKEGKNNKLRACDIKKIVDAVLSRSDVDKFSRKVSLEEIRENDYNLNIPRYVDSSDDAETWDIYATMFGGLPKEEIDSLAKYWNVFEGLKECLFEDNGSPFMQVKVEDVKASIVEHKSVLGFEKNFKSAFEGFEESLHTALIDNMQDIEIANGENLIAKDIFERVAKVALVDKYEAYQLLDDSWKNIAGDLEIIQTEGFESIKIVDPNIVIKKKDGKSQEVQEGYIGRIIPFDIVQSSILKEALANLKSKEEELEQVASFYSEVIDELSEDEKELVLNEAKDSFDNKKLAEKIKELKGDKDSKDFVAKLQKADVIIKKEKALKKQIKADSATLYLDTKSAIENLTKDEVTMLLEMKWVAPLVEELHKLPNKIIESLSSKIKDIVKKYDTSYIALESEISETEKSLSTILDELTGDDFDMQGISQFKKLLGE